MEARERQLALVPVVSDAIDRLNKQLVRAGFGASIDDLVVGGSHRLFRAREPILPLAGLGFVKAPSATKFGS